jgi:hypothetical protein
MSTVVDTEEENLSLRQQDQIRHARDQLRQIPDSTPIVVPRRHARRQSLLPMVMWRLVIMLACQEVTSLNVVPEAVDGLQLVQSC